MATNENEKQAEIESARAKEFCGEITREEAKTTFDKAIDLSNQYPTLKNAGVRIPKKPEE